MSGENTYTVLSPWGEVDAKMTTPLNPRLDDLNGKTIGMLAHFKGHSPYILREVEKEILKKYPEVKFSHLQYPKDTSEIEDDEEFLPIFKEWLSKVDGVIAAYGDAGSCAMYHAIGYDAKDEADAKLRSDDELPNFWLSFIPLVVLLGFCFVYVYIFKQDSTQGVVYATVIATALLYIFNRKYIKPGVNILREMSGQIVRVMPSMVGACVMYGFASIVAKTSVITSLAGSLANSSLNPFIIIWLGTMVLVAIMANGSSGALSFIGVLGNKLTESGVDVNAAHRLINITSASWDTLPHNSFINAMIPMFGYDIKSGYKYLLISNCVLPTCYSLFALILTLILYH